MKPHSFANYGVSFCNFMELLFYEVICRKASCREMLWLEIDYRDMDIAIFFCSVCRKPKL